jgi:hypothetical protein
VLNIIDEQDWYEDDYRKDAVSMSDCNSIPILHTPLCVGFSPGLSSIRSIRKEALYEKFFPHIEPILNELKKYYEYNRCSIFIARLKPGGIIDEHADAGPFLELCNRVHVPLKSNPKVRYVVDGKSYYWEPGKIYEFDNTRVHGVYNESGEDRIHLVINLYNLTDEQLMEDLI